MNDRTTAYDGDLIEYGAFENRPARFTDDEAWVLYDGKNWTEFNPAEVVMHAALLSAGQFQHEFARTLIPPLPAEAFASDPFTRHADRRAAEAAAAKP